MPTIPLHLASPSKPDSENPLPPLLHTPSGLALLELQGTIHFPPATADSATPSTLVGRIDFPLYNPGGDSTDTNWMKRVYLYIGENQRMLGQCKKLAKPFALIRRKEDTQNGSLGRVDGDVTMEGDDAENQRIEELEIAEIVKYKLVFSARPEPVTKDVEETEEPV